MFESEAPDLATGDTNGVPDIFVHDLVTGSTERVSVAGDGTQGDGRSFQPSVSGDGRFVVFASLASNLVPGDTNGFADVFLHDRQTGTTSRLSVAPDGSQAQCSSWDPSISDDGRFVSFTSGGTNLVTGDVDVWNGVFVRDLDTGATQRASVSMDGSPVDGMSELSSISADGRTVAFVADATNLVPADTNGIDDVFVRDLVAGVTTRISVSSAGSEVNGYSGAPSLSADGRFVAFFSLASDLVPDDDNADFDSFVHDRLSGDTLRVSVATDGAEATGGSGSPSISGDGRMVAFVSDAPNLVAADTNGSGDVFLHDLLTGTTGRASVAGDGSESGGASMSPSIGADGTRLAFVSDAADLVTGDTNGVADILLRSRASS